MHCVSAILLFFICSNISCTDSAYIAAFLAVRHATTSPTRVVVSGPSTTKLYAGPNFRGSGSGGGGGGSGGNRGQYPRRPRRNNFQRIGGDESWWRSEVTKYGLEVPDLYRPWWLYAHHERSKNKGSSTTTMPPFSTYDDDKLVDECVHRGLVTASQGDQLKQKAGSGAVDRAVLVSALENSEIRFALDDSAYLTPQYVDTATAEAGNDKLSTSNGKRAAGRGGIYPEDYEDPAFLEDFAAEQFDAEELL